MAPDADEPDLNPHWERVSPEFADERIDEQISKFDDERQKTGLRNVDKALKSIDAPAGLRLHYISTLAHLGRKASGHKEQAKDLQRDLERKD